MTQISRLRDAQITNGNVINADDLDTEYNQLVSESNAQDTRLTAIESGAITLQGVKTFTSAPKLDALEERTLSQGITAENVVLKAGSVQLSATILISGVDISTNRITTNQSHNIVTATGVRIKAATTLPSPLVATTTYFARAVSATEISLHPTALDATNNTNTVDITTTGSGTLWVLADPPSPQTGQVWYSPVSNCFKSRLNSQTTNLITSSTAVPPQTFMSGSAIVYTNANSITLPANLQAFDKTGVLLMALSSSQAVALNVSGANGLDTGTEAANTWYYLYLVGDTTGTNTPKGLFSLVNEAVTGSVTLPSGYNVKRQLPLALRNDASSNIVPFIQARLGDWVLYDGETSRTTAAGVVTVAAAPYNLLAGGTAATFTAVSAATMVPAISRLALVQGHQGTGTDFYGSVRPGGSANANGRAFEATAYNAPLVEIPLNTSQQFEYKRNFSTGTVHMDSVGWLPTEVI
ncbi:MAG: hypothetical protein QE263_08495 [Vampirovibrionales bacterium]|nr:hypothetical protein [Vampirovibrionales bacterium]